MPPNIRYYVDVFMLGVKHWGLSRFHILGHHTGASISTELAAVYGDQVLTLTVIGAVLLNTEEQQAYLAAEVHPYNKPVMDGSHLTKVWDQLLTNGEWNVKDLHEQTLDTVSAWEGRMQAYTCVFNQPAMEILGQVKVPVLALCAPDDSLYPKFYRVKEIVSLLVSHFGFQQVLMNASYQMLHALMLRVWTLNL
jgi:pimeloyl-ACP methyl ester carboxylesterase